MAAEDGDPRDPPAGPDDEGGEAGADGTEPPEQERLLQDEREEDVPAREPDCGEAAERGDGADAVQPEEGGAGRAAAFGVREGRGDCDAGDGTGQGAGGGPAAAGWGGAGV